MTTVMKYYFLHLCFSSEYMAEIAWLVSQPLVCASVHKWALGIQWDKANLDKLILLLIDQFISYFSFFQW